MKFRDNIVPLRQASTAKYDTHETSTFGLLVGFLACSVFAFGALIAMKTFYKVLSIAAYAF